MAALNLLAEPRSSGNEETWEHTGGKVLPEYHAAMFAATAAVRASATEVEGGNTLPWHPDDQYTSDVLFDVISSHSALSGPGKDDQRASTCNLPSTPTSRGRSSEGA